MPRAACNHAPDKKNFRVLIVLTCVACGVRSVTWNVDYPFLCSWCWGRSLREAPQFSPT